MNINMRIAELSWRECEHNEFSGRITSMKCRGRVWSKSNMPRNVSSGLNFGWFYSDVPEPINDLLLKTYQLMEVDLMERNIIPRAWPTELVDNDNDNEYPFVFRLKETCLVDTNWRMHEKDSPQESFCRIDVISKHHESTVTKCDLILPEEHVRLVFDTVDELL